MRNCVLHLLNDRPNASILLCIEGRLSLEVGHLHQARITESLRTGELKDPEVDRWLQYEQNTNPICLCIHLHSHIVGLATRLQSGERSIHFVD